MKERRSAVEPLERLDRRGNRRWQKSTVEEGLRPVEETIGLSGVRFPVQGALKCRSPIKTSDPRGGVGGIRCAALLGRVTTHPGTARSVGDVLVGARESADVCPRCTPA